MLRWAHCSCPLRETPGSEARSGQKQRFFSTPDSWNHICLCCCFSQKSHTHLLHPSLTVSKTQLQYQNTSKQSFPNNSCFNSGLNQVLQQCTAHQCLLSHDTAREELTSTVTITCFSHSTSHIGHPHNPVLENAFYFRNNFNSTGTTEHLSLSTSKGLIILTTLVKKAFLEWKPWSLHRRQKYEETNTVLLPKILLFQCFQIGLD